jgi:hypothetical protein
LKITRKIVIIDFGVHVDISEGCPEEEKMILAKGLLRKEIKKFKRDGKPIPKPTPIKLIGAATKNSAKYVPEVVMVTVTL